MSIQAIAWALRQRVKPAMSKLVLIAIANYANEDGMCWPSKSRLALDCSTDKSTICKHIRALREAGFIAVNERRLNGASQTSLIKLLMTPAPWGVGDSPPPQGGVGEEPGREWADTHQGSGCGAWGVVGETIPKPSIEPSYEPSAYPKGLPREELDSTVVVEGYDPVTGEVSP